MGLGIPHYYGKIQVHSVSNVNNVLIGSAFELYKNIYIQTFIELTLNLKSRFDQSDIERCKHTERLFFKAAKDENYSENHETVIH